MLLHLRIYKRKKKETEEEETRRNEIPENNGLFNVTCTYNKVAYSEPLNIQKFDGI